MKSDLFSTFTSLSLKLCFVVIVGVNVACYQVQNRNYDTVRDPQNAMTNDPALVWPGRAIRYLIHPELGVTRKEKVNEALKILEKRTCLTFRQPLHKTTPLLQRTVMFEPTTSQYNIHRPVVTTLVDSNACVIGVGHDKIEVRDILHYIFRLLGRGHEHTRPDRDKYVTIKWENILSGCSARFNSSRPLITQSLPYDYESIMHYVSKAFTRNGQSTIVPNNCSVPHQLLGSSDLPTDMDYMHINFLYCQATSIMIPQMQTTPATTYIDLNWPPPRYLPDHYTVLVICTFANHVPQKESLYESGTIGNLRILNLQPGSTCEIVFHAIYNSATLDHGIKHTVTLLSELPSASPPGVQIVQVEKTYAVVVWDALHSNHTNGVILGYKLGIKEHLPTSEYQETTILSKMNRKYTFKYLFPCTKYHVKVAAFNSAGVGPYSNPTTLSTKGACTKVVRITKIASFPYGISVQWRPVTDEIMRGLYIELQYKSEFSTEWKIKLIPPPATQCVIEDLLPNTKVLLKLRTVSENGAFGPVTQKAVQTARE